MIYSISYYNLAIKDLTAVELDEHVLYSDLFTYRSRLMLLHYHSLHNSIDSHGFIETVEHPHLK